MPSFFVNFSDNFFDLITALAYDEGVSKEEMIRTVFATYAYLKKEMRKNNTRLAFIDSKNAIINILVMPWEHRE